jgi:DNA-binding NarL/FixJ family response regulator
MILISINTKTINQKNSMEPKIRIALVDECQLFRNGLALLLKEFNYIQIVAEANNGKEFLDVLDKIDIDLVLMDINMPLMSGIIATRLGIQKQPSLKVIALTANCNEELLQMMLDAGALGFLLKNIKKDILDMAIKAVWSGNNYYSEEVLEILTKSYINSKQSKEEKRLTLSARELEILKLICNGLSNHQIGEKLGVSHRTIEGHRANIIDKIGVKNTVNLVAYAIMNNLVNMNN